MACWTVLTTIAGSAPYQRLEVALVQGRDGRLTIDLREQHYAEGIGWFDQRALELDSRQFRQLQEALGAKSAQLGADLEKAPVSIPFPGPRTAAPARAAAGDA